MRNKDKISQSLSATNLIIENNHLKKCVDFSNLSVKNNLSILILENKNHILLIYDAL